MINLFKRWRQARQAKAFREDEKYRLSQIALIDPEDAELQAALAAFEPIDAEYKPYFDYALATGNPAPYSDHRKVEARWNAANSRLVAAQDVWFKSRDKKTKLAEKMIINDVSKDILKGKT